jgi:two-component system, chemotaxis family, chemotaxis protein CheY
MAKILVLDDSITMLSMLTKALQDEGHQVDDVRNGNSALDLLKQKEITLIVTDINMPEMDGISFVKAVRKIDQYKFIPILALTTESSYEKRMEGKNIGISGWIVKPFNPQKVIKAVNVLLEKG